MMPDLIRHLSCAVSGGRHVVTIEFRTDMQSIFELLRHFHIETLLLFYVDRSKESFKALW